VALQAGELEEAQRLLERAAASKPEDVRARLALAASQAAAGKTAAAIGSLEKLGVEQRDQYQSDVMLVMMHLRAGAWDKAQSALAGLEGKQPRNPLTHNLRGTVLGRKGDAKGARAAFERALSLEPRYSPAARNLVRLDLREGKTAEAQARLEAFLASSPSDAAALLALADLKARTGTTRDEVGALLEQARADNPRLLPPRLALVRWHLQGGDVRKAVETAQEAEWAFPRHPEALSLLGESQLRAGDVAQALVTYRKAVKLHERVSASHFALGRAQIAANDLPGARKSLERALQLDPGHLGARLATIEVEARANRPQEALRLAHAFQKAQPARAEGYALEGDILNAQKKHAEAAAAYRKALDASADGLFAIQYHTALAAANESAAADAFRATWLQKHPRDTAFRTYFAQRLLAAGSYEPAKAALLELIALQGETAPVLNNLAWAGYKTKDARALEYAEKAHKLAPNDAHVLDTLGMIRLERGEIEIAAPLLARARALAPEVPAIRLHHAASLASSGKREEARVELRELLAIKEPFPERDEVQKLLATL
jgi:putative PEP-CTERM system TPR-repeat lipoprotein